MQHTVLSQRQMGQLEKFKWSGVLCRTCDLAVNRHCDIVFFPGPLASGPAGRPRRTATTPSGFAGSYRVLFPAADRLNRP